MTTTTEQTLNIAVRGLTEVHGTDNDTYVYGAVGVTVNGEQVDVGVVVGARERNREEAHRVGLRGYLTAECDNDGDLDALDVVARTQGLDLGELYEGVVSALKEAAPWLWRESEALRNKARCNNCGRSAHYGRCEE